MSDLSEPAVRSAAEQVAIVLDLLTLDRLDEDRFVGMRKPGGRGRVFGGQVVAQALVAARATVAGERPAHSLHAYFMRPGSEDHNVEYRVERDRDGGSFSSRRVVALQEGMPILSLSAGFQRPEGGADHAAPMPDVPPPEGLESETAFYRRHIDAIPERMRAWVTRPRPIEQRPVDPVMPADQTPDARPAACWFRVAAPVPDDADLHRALIAYASDTRLLGAAMRPNGWSFWDPAMQVASLDHALWLHEPARADEWLLYVTDSPWTGHGRGMCRGSIFAADGRLVASVAQEGLVRRREARG